jgi:hypothetical protein
VSSLKMIARANCHLAARRAPDHPYLVCQLSGVEAWTRGLPERDQGSKSIDGYAWDAHGTGRDTGDTRVYTSSGLRRVKPYI